MNIIHYLLENTERFPEKPAIIFEDTVLTYSDLSEKTRRLSYALKDIGVEVGTKIGIILNNGVEFAISMLAAADLGATVVPMNTTLGIRDLRTAITSTDMDYIIGSHFSLRQGIEGSGPELLLSRQNYILVDGEIDGCLNFGQLLERSSGQYSLGECVMDDETDFILTMTSGSTSAPKPIVFSQTTKVKRSLGAQELYDVTDDDVTLLSTPMYHSISQRLVLMPLITGGTCVIMKGFAPRVWFTLVDRHKVSFCIVVSSQLEVIMEELVSRDTYSSSLRCIVCCCAMLKEDVKRRLMTELQCEFHECYGASEVGIVSNLSSSDGLSKHHTVGRAAPGVEIKIVDTNRNSLEAGVIGEIACKSPMQFSRYYNNEKATSTSMEDDFFFTGDTGYLDEDDFLVFTGRTKELVITGGTNVYPSDVEAVLNEHPCVKECAIIGVEDVRLGEAILALVICQTGVTLTARDLQLHCMHRLADYQQPLGYVFLDDFPRTELGKVIKHKLVERYRDHDLTADIRAVLDHI